MPASSPTNTETVFGNVFHPQSLPENTCPPVPECIFVSQFTGFAAANHRTYSKYLQNYPYE
jgi:hypothetical protein